MVGQVSEARLRAGLGAYSLIKKQRTTRQARVLQQLEQTLLEGQQQALAVMVATAAAGKEQVDRRHVERATGKWRGSTLSGYLRGDDITYKENFRMTRETFGRLLKMMEGEGAGV